MKSPISSLIIALFVSFFLASVAHSQLVWQDDFESYPLNSFPSPPWHASGNTGGGYIDDSVSFSGSQSLHLFGVIGGCWAVNVARAITCPPPFTIEFMVYNGSENVYGCNPFRASLYLFTGPNWEDCWPPGGCRRLILFHPDGRIELNDSLGWHYNEQEWVKVRVDYSRLTDTYVHLIYWVNDQLLYEVNSPNISNEDNLTYVHIVAQEGTVWFDDVKVYASCNAIPTLTEWGLIIFGVVLLGFITWVFLKRRKAAVSLR